MTDPITLLAFVVVAGLAVFLTAALLVPERFS
ncbi:MAG: potassium-transporting ATPase subunit F [Planctomycetia bacterium]|nr:potassium-transporting ATPase subunit F [Planctomycetia bacterium]